MFVNSTPNPSSGDNVWNLGNIAPGGSAMIWITVQVLPTARQYAQLPFFNLMNAADLFVQLLLTPHARLSVRTDYHWLRLSERRDFWYAGSGAGKEDLFGYSGTDAHGHRQLASLADLSVGVVLHERLTMNAYYGHAFGQGVVGATFADTNADYGYLELLFRY